MNLLDLLILIPIVWGCIRGFSKGLVIELATLAGMVWLPLGQMLGWLFWLPLAWSVWMVQLTAPLPFASLDLGTFPFWLLMLMYAAIAADIEVPETTWLAPRQAHRVTVPPLSTIRLNLSRETAAQ